MNASCCVAFTDSMDFASFPRSSPWCFLRDSRAWYVCAMRGYMNLWVEFTLVYDATRSGVQTYKVHQQYRSGAARKAGRNPEDSN